MKQHDRMTMSCLHRRKTILDPKSRQNYFVEDELLTFTKWLLVVLESLQKLLKILLHETAGNRSIFYSFTV